VGIPIPKVGSISFLGKRGYLAILTWLRQLQEHFFKQSEIKESIDWYDFRQYCNVPLKHAVTKGVNNVHMSKANTANAVKIDSFDSIKPNKKNLKKLSNLFSNGRRGFCIGKVPMCRT
jgi:hypothetical protein